MFKEKTAVCNVFTMNIPLRPNSRSLIIKIAYADKALHSMYLQILSPNIHPNITIYVVFFVVVILFCTKIIYMAWMNNL